MYKIMDRDKDFLLLHGPFLLFILFVQTSQIFHDISGFGLFGLLFLEHLIVFTVDPAVFQVVLGIVTLMQ